jgi:cell division protein FtsQ
MARNGNPQIPDEVRPGVRAGSGELEDRFSDLEPEQDSPFLRAQKRVPVRRGPLPKKAANRVKIALIVLMVLAAVGVVWAALDRYGTHSWRFQLESSDNIEVTGNAHVSRGEITRVFGGDISRNIFAVPLDDRKKQLEQVPWVESATVMRILPDHLHVSVVERKPIAFAQVGSRVQLIDAHGVLMEMPFSTMTKYSFPVIVGMHENEPLSTRSARMKIYQQLVNELDAGGEHNSHTLSEVDLSDPEDVRITVDDPDGAVLVHLGSSNFAERFRIYVTHLKEWRQQYQHLESVDLRYDRQVILNPDSHPSEAKAVSPETPKPKSSQHAATQAKAKSASVKPSAHKSGRKQ